MTSRLLAVAAIFLVAASVSAEDPPSDEAVPESEPIVFSEPVDWDDPVPWGGYPPPWFEDPASVDCGGRDACEASLENQTAGRGL